MTKNGDWFTNEGKFDFNNSFGLPGLPLSELEVRKAKCGMDERIYW